MDSSKIRKFKECVHIDSTLFPAALESRKSTEGSSLDISTSALSYSPCLTNQNQMC